MITYDQVDALCGRLNQRYHGPKGIHQLTLNDEELRILYIAMVAAKAQLKEKVGNEFTTAIIHPAILDAENQINDTI